MTDVIEFACRQADASATAATPSPAAMELLQPEPGEVRPSRSRPRLWLMVLALNAVLFVAALDQTIVAYATSEWSS